MAFSKDRATARQELFDAFVSSRKLEIEEDNWPVGDQQDWEDLILEFNKHYPLP